MDINNFRVISYDAHPEKSIYNLIDRKIEDVKVLVQSDICEKSNIVLKEACVFVEISNKWISAIYEQKFNPSESNNFISFMKDFKRFVAYLRNN